MSKREKIVILVLVVLVAIALGIWLWQNNKIKEQNKELEQQPLTQTNTTTEEYVQNLEDGSKVNISEEFNKEKKLDELTISNIQFREVGGITTLLADVTNNTGKTSEERMVKIEVIDKNGGVITTLRGTVDRVEDGQKVQLNIGVTADVANAYDFRISWM